jgi:hypothetical protein
MSLTSYRAAPPRDGWRMRQHGLSLYWGEGVCEWVLLGTMFRAPRAAMPGDDLLFHCLGSSTIGAVGFHGRVRDGIGWDTDAMVTRQ